MATKTVEQYREDSAISRPYKVVLTLSSTPTTAGNYSDVSYSFVLHALNSDCAYHFNYGNRVYLTINGSEMLNTSNVGSIHFSGMGSYTLASGSIRVPHNADGDKTISFQAVFQQTQNTALANYNISGTMDLDTIARASHPSCITYPDTTDTIGDMGTQITIHTNRASTSFTHTLRYSWYDKTGTIATDVTDNCKWTIPLSFANDVTTATSSWGTIYCDTYSDDTLIGTKSVKFTATVPGSMVPSLSIAVSEAASIPSALSGIYVQGVSRLKIVSTASGSYGSAIKKYTVTADESTYSGESVTTNVIKTAGTVSVKVTVTDSRGRSVTKTTDISMTAYSKPTITSVSAYRCASATDWTADPDGAYICIAPRGSITALSNKNSKSCIAYYKKASTASYSSKTVNMTSYSLTSDQAYVIVAADVSSSYDVYVTLTDSFCTMRANAAQVMSAGSGIHFAAGKKRIGIFKRAESDGIDIGGDVLLHKNVKIYTNTEMYNLPEVFPHGSLKRREYRHDANGTKAYYLIASATLNANYQNAILNLLITRTHPIGSTKADILNVAVRRNDGAGIAESKIAWATPHVSDGSQWHLVIDGAKAYVYLEVSGQYYTFDVQAITNSGRVASEGNPWTLTESDSTGVSSLPSGTDIKASAYDTGWTDITLSSGVSAVSYVGAKVRRIGSMVNVRFGVTGATAAFQVLGTIPSGYRPPQEINVGARYYNKLDIAVAIEDTGEIKCLASNVAYDSSALLAFNTTYFI